MERFDTIVIGGGQTGLVVGYELAQRDQNFAILDAAERVGDAWRNRWDSLVLFTQARLNGLPGLDFPGDPEASITKDAVADFLERYAQEMMLPVRSGVRVERLSHDGFRYHLETTGGDFEADNVVVAMADYQEPRVPAFADGLADDIVQLHAADYKNPGQLQDGDALVVGLGNSGADIGFEIANTPRTTYVSGKESGAIPFRIESWFGRKFGQRLVRFFAVNVLNTATAIGRRARPKMLKKASPLVRVRPKELAAAGVVRVPRVTGIVDGKPELADGRALDVANIIWCTGFRPGFDWIDLPVFDEEGRPRQRRGIVDGQPGLYFCGLFFQHALWSETLTGMQVDARYVVEHLMERTKRATSPASTE